MSDVRVLKGCQRTQLLDELTARYCTRGSFAHRFTYLRKKYSWLLVVNGANLAKRLLDLIIGTALLCLFSPLLLLIAAGIKLSDGGPVLYVATRVGKWGKEFRFPKFRSMIVGAESKKASLLHKNFHKVYLTFKMKKDPRVTPLGYLLRKSSLDELPQLWCVVKGDMSLVGPRPPLPDEVQHYTLEDRRRLDVKPGLTCLWQVSGRSDIPFPEQLRLDLRYIESQSIWLDCWLLCRTIPAVILGKGAY